jgi:fibronectin-binding autotransporter adhesin
VLDNAGTVEGARGAYSYYGDGIYNGGAGAYVSSSNVTNSGRLIGGIGGNSVRSTGGNGGVGIVFSYGTLTNSGTIAGGAGGSSGSGFGGNGNAAVILDGGELIDTGTIDGGAAGQGSEGDGTSGVAIQFGGPAGTLAISPGAVFEGAIEANLGVNDTLVLEGKGSGTLSGFGTLVTNFTTIDENAKTNWTLVGSVTGPGSLNMGKDATLTLSGSVSIATLSFGKGGDDTLNLAKSTPLTSALSGFGAGDVIDLAGIQASSLKYADQTLTLLGAGGSVVDTLVFDGNYKQADFALQATHDGTEVIFSGTIEPGSRLADFWPPISADQAGGMTALYRGQDGAFPFGDAERNLDGNMPFHFAGASFVT